MSYSSLQTLSEEGSDSMKPIMIVGIVLCLAGILMLVFHAKMTTTHEDKVGLGFINTTVQTKKEISPVWGGLILAGGVVCVVLGGKK